VAANLSQQIFEADRAAYIVKAIKDRVETSPLNCFESFDGERIFDEPLVGFADGDDPIFKEYKTIIGDFHLTPREALQNHLQSIDIRQGPAHVSVVSFILPVSYKTRLSLRKETLVPSLRWNHTRWQGQDFIYDLSRYVTSLLESLGYRAVAPELADFYKINRLPAGYAANWSQRHAAYAAGLGTFSLNDGFITPKGMAMRCGSVVTDAIIPPSPRLYSDHLANCLFYYNRSCNRCAQRCPAGAIDEKGHDKNKCREFLFNRQKEIVRELHREEGYIGGYLGCGLCQTKVPCEARIPPRKKPGDSQEDMR
jgi:epoxyqueuosine reductase QueG